MTNYVDGKVVVITGAGGGFGRRVAELTAALGAKVVGIDISAEGLETSARTIRAEGGTFEPYVGDVTDMHQVGAAAAHAVDRFGCVDVLVNNAGIMPLAFYVDHQSAWQAWDKCIDINIKGVLHGIAAVYDQMISQGRGHVVNVSSISGNFPLEGSAVYGATKAAVNVLSESLRIEAQGKIKVTVVRPTWVPGTGLGDSVINPESGVGITGNRTAHFVERVHQLIEGTLPDELTDENNPRYWAINPTQLAENIVYAINQPWGVSISDITVRASGENFVI